MTRPGDCVRIGTLNTGTLAGRVATVAALATMLSLDVLALQETRVPVHSRSAVESAFRLDRFNTAPPSCHACRCCLLRCLLACCRMGAALLFGCIGPLAGLFC